MNRRILFAIDISAKEKNEPPIIKKKKQFIYDLISKTESTGLTKQKINSLGVLQASELIDQLIDIRDGNYLV